MPDIQAAIETFARQPAELEALVKEMPEALWNFKPAPDSWSLHEILVHITDVEVNYYIRLRRAIAEPGKNVMAFDQNDWAKNLFYTAQSWQDALQVTILLRRMTIQLLRSLPDESWSRTVDHPEQGMLRLDYMVEAYAYHIPDHLKQIRENYQAWVGQTQV